jgi:hypothetical protein
MDGTETPKAAKVSFQHRRMLAVQSIKVPSTSKMYAALITSAQYSRLKAGSEKGTHGTRKSSPEMTHFCHPKFIENGQGDPGHAQNRRILG